MIEGVRRRRGAQLFCAFVAFLAVVDYLWTFRDLALGGISEGRAVLALAVLAGTAVLVHDRWTDVRKVPLEPSRWGLVFIAASLLLLFVGTRAGVVFVQGMTSVFLRGLSLVTFLCGAAILLLGWKAMRYLWMPALLLVFVYPENALTAYWVPLRLQTVAAVLSTKVVAMLGIPVVRQGHVLETAAMTANVEEACSGIRSLQTVVPAAIFISAYGLGRPALKAALIALSIPVVLLANIVRIVVTVLIATHVSVQAAQGFFHYFAGLGMFMFCLVILLVIWQGLQHADRARREGPAAGKNDAPARPGRRRWPGSSRITVSARAGIAMACFLGLGVVYQGLELWHVRAVEQRQKASPLALMPRTLGKWTSQDLPDPLGLDRQRHVSDALFRAYRAPGEPEIHVTLLYWRTGEGTVLGRRAHLPEGCYPYHGMAELWSETRELATASALLPAAEVRTSAFIARGGNVIVTSWQQAGLSTEPLERKAYSGKVGQLIYGLREILRMGSDYPAEIALQLSTTGGGPEDRVKSAQARLASLIIGQAVDLVLAAPSEPGPAAKAAQPSAVPGL